MVTEFDSLFQKVSQTYYKLQQVQTQLKLNEDSEEDTKTKLFETENKVQLLDSASVVFKSLQEKLTDVHINHITDLLNNALHSVFDDDYIQYRIRLEVSQQRNNNTVQFYLQTTEGGSVTETLLTNNGFGIQSLLGFVLQVYFILQHKQARILFLDESLTAISTDKLPKLKKFIDEVANQYQFKFVLIAHMEELFSLADYAYSVDNGKVTPIILEDNS